MASAAPPLVVISGRKNRSGSLMVLPACTDSGRGRPEKAWVSAGPITVLRGRFLSAPARMDEVAGQMLAGQVRSVIGGATVEQIIGHRDRVTQEIKKRSRAELETLGIVVDALEIQEIEDTSGYISNLAAPRAAAVARQARMAQANADLEASEREREVAELR
jgi:regulator of protease activity HflC (stomatin/prohibitin superfamily)